MVKKRKSASTKLIVNVANFFGKLRQAQRLENVVELVPRTLAFDEEECEPSEEQHPAARDS